MGLNTERHHPSCGSKASVKLASKPVLLSPPKPLAPKPPPGHPTGANPRKAGHHKVAWAQHTERPHGQDPDSEAVDIVLGLAKSSSRLRVGDGRPPRDGEADSPPEARPPPATRSVSELTLAKAHRAVRDANQLMNTAPALSPSQPEQSQLSRRGRPAPRVRAMQG